MNIVMIKIMVLGLSRREKGDEMPYLPLALLAFLFPHSLFLCLLWNRGNFFISYVFM
jgi:hypothetical protein